MLFSIEGKGVLVEVSAVDKDRCVHLRLKCDDGRDMTLRLPVGQAGKLADYLNRAESELVVEAMAEGKV